MALKNRITIIVPKNLQKDLREHVIKDGYGMRGKSKWVSEAIEKLLAINNYPELVNFCDEMSDFDKVETIVIDSKIQSALEKAIVEIRKQYPILEGVKSRIVRTAILQRLLRS